MLAFLRDYIPGLITSEILPVPEISVALDAQALPFGEQSLRAVVMTNVLHHIARPRDFFAEAGRCVRDGGALIMIEPWVSLWSKLIYKNLHHEPFDPECCAGSSRRVAPFRGRTGPFPGFSSSAIGPSSNTSFRCGGFRRSDR